VRNTVRTCLACFVLASLCAPAAVAQGVGAQEPEIRRQIAPAATVLDETYLPSAEELNEVHIDERLLLCIERLGDPAFAVRETATGELRTGHFVRWQIYAALSRLHLSGEQRYRLMTAVQEDLLLTPRGAVGIGVNQRLQQRENKIVVERLLPDLPAQDVLLIGDRITHLHGKPLPNWRAFVKEVQTRAPGAKIIVTVERLISPRRSNRRLIGAEEPRFTTLDIEIELGSAEMLRDPISGKIQRTGEVFLALKKEAGEVGVAFAPQPKQIRLGK